MSKSIPAAASVIAAFLMTAPSGSQAKTTEDTRRHGVIAVNPAHNACEWNWFEIQGAHPHI